MHHVVSKIVKLLSFHKRLGSLLMKNPELNLQQLKRAKLSFGRVGVRVSKTQTGSAPGSQLE